jgi:hypothetical protein
MIGFLVGCPTLAYLTPETVVPILSVMAGGAGILIGLGIRILRLPLVCLRGLRTLIRRGRAGAPTDSRLCCDCELELQLRPSGNHGSVYL